MTYNIRLDTEADGINMWDNRKEGVLSLIKEESDRIKNEIEDIKFSLKTIGDDIDREKSIVIDANSNEKRLKEEKHELIEIDSKYYDTEKKSNEDLDAAKNKLNLEIDKVKELISAKKNDEAISILDNCKIIIEEYADSYSKNQNIKKESIKRNERIKVIEKEIESWKNLLVNSEKMINELNERKQKLIKKLEELEKQPQSQAEKKGQLTENLRLSEIEKEAISAELLRHKGNKKEAAAALGVSRSTIHRKIEDYEIDLEELGVA